MQTNHVEGQEIFKIKEYDLNQLIYEMGGSNSSYIEGMKRADIIDLVIHYFLVDSVSKIF